jgi:hypothetical protein
MATKNTPTRNKGRIRRLETIEYRFVYEGEIKGFWYPVSLHTLHRPDSRTVIRLEFRDKEDLG